VSPTLSARARRLSVRISVYAATIRKKYKKRGTTAAATPIGIRCGSATYRRTKAIRKTFVFPDFHEISRDIFGGMRSTLDARPHIGKKMIYFFFKKKQQKKSLPPYS
jgi:hypothetical protein